MTARSFLSSVRALGLSVALAALAAPALAQGDPALEAARAQGVVGEQADGFLGVVEGADASADVRARVDQINIRRRAAYTEIAGRRGVTLREVAAATGCNQLANRVGPNQPYQDETGAWRTRAGGAPVPLPAYCPQ